MGIDLRLLGGFTVVVDDTQVPVRAWRLRKARTLVKLLALAPRRTLHRGQLIDLLWPDHEPPRAANNLDQAVHAARRALGPDAIAVHDELVTLAPSAASDVDAFEEAAASARSEGSPARLEAAVALYSGDLLPEDRYEPWSEPRRALLREQFAALRLRLAEDHEGRGRTDEALSCAQRVLHDDPLYEPAHRYLMSCYARAGRRQDALQQFEVLRAQLRRRFEAEPDEVTRALYRKLLATAWADGPGPRKLPVQLTSFLGREQELQDVAEVLSSARMVTLAGAGGAGKTRLAVAAAEASADRFPDGTWFVDLGRLADPALVAEEAATAVGIQVPAQRSPADALAQHLGLRSAFLLLDTCEHVIGASALLVEELLERCPRLTVLATSREPLRCRGEHVWRVPGLGRTEAVELFAARASQADPAFTLTDANRGDVEELCLRLDGMPLGIELAAARVDVLSPARISLRLRESLDVLGGGARTALTRQQTLRAAIGWSYDLLDEREAAVYRRLAVFAGSFDADAAEAVCADGIVHRRDVFELLARLAAKSLVTVDVEPARYRLLDTIRQFGTEMLEGAGERNAAEQRLRAWAQQLAERERDVAALDLDHDNIRAALASGLDEAPDAALLLAATVWRLWLDRTYLTEGARYLRAALDRTSEPSPTRATAQLAAGSLAVRLGEPPEIVEYVRGAETTARVIGEPRLLADVLHAEHLYLMPSVFMVKAPGLRPGFEGIVSPLAEALALADTNGADDIAASALHASALMHVYRGELAEARSALESALERLALVDARSPPFFEGVTVGFPVLPEGPGGRPRAIFEQTILMFHRFARDQAVAFTLANLAVLSRCQGRTAEARAQLDEAMARYRALRDREGEALVLTGLGNWARTCGEPDRARAYLEDALALRVDGGDHRAVASTEWDLALATAAGGELDAARQRFAALRERLRLADDGPGYAGVLIDWGIAEERAGELGRAEELLSEGSEHWNVVSRGPWLGWCRLALADVRGELGDEGGAAAAIEGARAIFEQMGDARGLELCRVPA